MRILLLTHYFAPENGAPQRRWSALAERLTRRGHEVDVICPQPHYPRGRLIGRKLGGRARVHVDPSGARVFRVSFLPHDGRIHSRTIDHIWVAAASVARASGLIRRGVIRPDVIVATAPAMESLAAGHVLARRFSLPLVAEMRDAWPDLVVHTPGLSVVADPTSFVKRQVHQFITRLQRRADAVVTTTDAFAEVLRDRHVSPVFVLRNATELRRYASVTRGEGAVDRPLRVLYMGTIGRSQGLDIVIEAVATLVRAGVSIDARFVGQGADLPRLRRLNRRLGSPVELLGPVQGSEVRSHYIWADSTIVSLRSWEPFSWTVPSKLYELLATGKHVTGIVAGEAASIIRDACAGDVVAPGDREQLVKLWSELSADRSRLAIGDRGRLWVREHADFDSIADEYLNLLRSAVAARQLS